jgi:hypothetical protein
MVREVLVLQGPGDCGHVFLTAAVVLSSCRTRPRVTLTETACVRIAVIIYPRPTGLICSKELARRSLYKHSQRNGDVMKHGVLHLQTRCLEYRSDLPVIPQLGSS